MSEAADVPRLARLWDERLRRDLSRFAVLVPEAAKSTSVLREPATEQAIARAEQRLGMQLPATYRAFLLCSDGAWASSLGPETQVWGETDRHGFLPVEEVDRLDASEDGRFLIGLWTGEEHATDRYRDVPATGNDGTEVGYYAPLRDALLISQPWDAFKDLLVPRSGSEDWEVWLFAREGAIAYRNFAAFLSGQINKPDRRPNPTLADLYAADVRDGKRPRLDDLAEIGDPRVSELALAYMLDPNVEEFMKRGWARPVGDVADPASARALRRVYEHATIPDFRLELLYGLIRCGDPDIEQTLRTVANDPTDGAQCWAAYALARLPWIRPIRA